MIPIVSALIGGLLGARAAKKRGGKGLDIAQYATAFAIAFALLGVIFGIVIENLAG